MVKLMKQENEKGGIHMPFCYLLRKGGMSLFFFFYFTYFTLLIMIIIFPPSKISAKSIR